MEETSKSVLRLQADFIVFDAGRPFDDQMHMSRRGTAFLLRDGDAHLIVTAHHVIENHTNVFATSQHYNSGEPMECTVIGQNPHLDVAILKCDHPNLRGAPAFQVQTSSHMKPRDVVSVVGFAQATIRTHETSGTISARHGYPHNRFQTHAAIYGGNSGGPVLSAQGGVVGLVTTGEDDAENINYFLPSDEMMHSIRRMQAAFDPATRIGVDLGLQLDAFLSAVHSSACFGKPGGMRVVRAREGIGLKEGDVILKCEGPKSEMLTLNSFGRVQCDDVYRHDTVDFRTVLDLLPQNEQKSRTWKLEIRRGSRHMLVSVDCGPSRLDSRERFPDCEPVTYLSFGGIIFQNAHPGIFDTSDPGGMFEPNIVASAVLAGSPYAQHDAQSFLGKCLEKVHFIKGAVEISSLAELERLLSEQSLPPTLEFDNGAFVGASADGANKFHSKTASRATAQGLHLAGRGHLISSDDPELRLLSNNSGTQTSSKFAPPCSPAVLLRVIKVMENMATNAAVYTM